MAIRTGALTFAALLWLSPWTGQAAELNPKNPLNPPAPIFWCPHRTADQQYSATAEPGCSPLIGKRETLQFEEKIKRGTVPPLMKIENIQNEASRFAREYRRFLDCCADEVDSLDDLDRLEEQAVDLLIAIQKTGLINAAYEGCFRNCRGWTNSEIIRSVAGARDDLRTLKTRLERLGEAMNRAYFLDYLEAGRERLRIQDEKDTIRREFASKRPPAAPLTGMEIEDTSLPSRRGTTIEDSTLVTGFGPDIGYIVSPDSDQRTDLNPRSGLDTQSTSLPTRFGTGIGGGNTPATTLPNTTGFEIGTNQGPTGPSNTITRVGPMIGDSSLNQTP